MTVINYM